jgi:hypothetical protein
MKEPADSRPAAATRTDSYATLRPMGLPLGTARNERRVSATFNKLAGRQRKLPNDAKQIEDNEMCSNCGHSTTGNGTEQWDWLVAMSCLLPQEWECKAAPYPGDLCGCSDPTHLRAYG